MKDVSPKDELVEEIQRLRSYTRFLESRLRCQQRISDDAPCHSPRTESDAGWQHDFPTEQLELDRKYRQLYEGCRDAIATVSMKGRIIECNSVFLDMLGYTCDEMHKLSYQDITPKKWHALEEKIIAEQVMKRGYSDVYEKECRRKDGTVFPVELRTYLATSHDGSSATLWAWFRDITERKRVELILRESEERFRALVESSSDWIWEVDADGVYTYASPQILSVLGYQPAEVIGRTPFCFMSPEEAERVRELYWKRFTRGEPLVMLKNTNLHKDGHCVVLETNGVPILDAAGTVLGYRGVARDITKRQEAEETLRRSEEKYRLINENMPVVVYSALPDEKSTSLFVSGSSYDLTGYACECYMKDPNLWLSIIHPKDKAFVIEALKEHRRRKSMLDVEYRVIARSGATKWVRDKARPTLNEAGRIVRIDGFMEDITERKRAEEQLRETRLFTDCIVQTAKVIIIGLDTQGCIQVFNRAAESITGYTKEELVGKDWFETLVPRDRYPRVWRDFQRSWKGDLPNIMENPILTKDGQEREISWSNSIIRRESGFWGTISIGVDITERKRAECALVKERDFIKTVIHSSPALIGAINMDGTIRFINQAMLDALGYTEEEVVGQTYMSMFVPQREHAMLSRIFRKLQKGIATCNENHIRTRDGHERLVEWRGAPVLDTQGNTRYFIGMGIDITERKRAEAQLLEYQTSLRSLSNKLLLTEERERRRIATCLHDGACQSLAMANLQLQTLYSTLDPEQQKVATEVCQSLELVVQELRDLTFDLSPPTLYMLGLEGAIEELLDQELRAKHGLTYEMEVAKGCLPLAHDLRVLLYQSVRELVINTVKHAQADHIRVTLRQKDHKVYLTLSDNGIGFNHKHVKTKISSTGGFGLFNISERLRSIGGEMQIVSSPGQGSRFTLSIPVAESGPMV